MVGNGFLHGPSSFVIRPAATRWRVLLARVNYYEADVALVVGASVQPLLDLDHTARRHTVATHQRLPAPGPRGGLGRGNC